MFPFDRPKDYGEMLNKIGIFTFLVALALTWFVADRVPSISAVLNLRQTTFDVASLHVPILYVVVAGVVALSARIIRLHDRLSNIFKIRETFDVEHILLPLCVAVGVAVNGDLRSKLKANRKVLMASTFYRYASFEDPKISKASVLAAIELWTWYWIILEASFLIVIAALGFLLGRDLPTGLALLCVSVGLALTFLTCFYSCGTRAEDEIREILSDGERLVSIKAELLKFE